MDFKGGSVDWWGAVTTMRRVACAGVWIHMETNDTYLHQFGIRFHNKDISNPETEYFDWEERVNARK